MVSVGDGGGDALFTLPQPITAMIDAAAAAAVAAAAVAAAAAAVPSNDIDDA